MAFDLIGPTRRTLIDHHEELLFDVATLADVRGPALDRLWDHFYDGPRFSPVQAAALAGEFRALLTAIESKPELVRWAWEAQTSGYKEHFPLSRFDELLSKCRDLVAVCEDGAESPEGLSSLSD